MSNAYDLIVIGGGLVGGAIVLFFFSVKFLL